MKTIEQLSQSVSAVIEDILELKETVSDEVHEHLDAMEAFLEYALEAADRAESAKSKAH
jgi:hypothetical protein